MDWIDTILAGLDDGNGISTYELPSVVEKVRFVRRQRRLMTKRLRYEIMARDGFRCVKCGRGPSDGVILEVDHICPVSAGGRTEPDNLETLCRDCNRGKSSIW